MNSLNKSPKLWLEASRIDEIRRSANDALRSVGYEGGAVPIEDVAKSLGANVKYAPYDGELAGMLIRGAGAAVIAVNSAHHKNRQRFTIAHECGHLKLHLRDFFVDKSFAVLNRDQKSSKAEDIMEIEANQFAAEILMPARNIISDIKECNLDLEDDNKVRNIAKAYGVSQQAMTYRIANILFSNNL